MAFPSNPITGTTYGITDRTVDRAWFFNGYAWQKYDTTPNDVYTINGITGDIGLSAGPDISISLTGKTFTISSETLYGVSGSIYASNLATGLLHGGIISINAGNTATFDITAGRGQIHASGSTYTRDPLPTLNYVSWSGQTGITVTNLATSDTTWLYIDGSGVLNQRTEYYTDNQIENTIIIGQLVHPSRTFINLSRTNPNVAYATDKQYEQFIRAFGPIKISGHTITANGANLKLNRSSGKAFGLGRNWINNTDDPSVVSDAARTDCIFYRYYRGATVGTFITVPNQTVIDPAHYDNGSGVLQSVPGGKYTIQRIFYYPNTPTLLGVYYGRNTYVSLAEAAANLNLEDFSEIENTRTNAVFAAYLVVKGNATSLLNTSDALIIQAGSFRSTSSGGGSVSLTIDDLTDVIISSPQNYEVLTYVDGLTGWENRSVSTLPLVSSINGITGISVSGNTGNVTITNTGVLSINGRTGAVTGLSASTVMIGSTNSNFTRYLVFAATAGEQSLLVDNVTTPLSYNPNTGTISAKMFEATQGSNTVKIDAPSGTIFNSDSANTNTVVPYGFEFSSGGGPYFFASVSQPIFFVTSAFRISDGDYDQIYGPSTWGYTFPAANGSSGQAMLTNGSGQLYWGTISGSSTSTGVSSFNGQTGAVVFNNYVSSINGITGAITNVAKTNEGNTFSVLQVMNAGITSSTLFVTLGTTLANVSATTTTNTVDIIASTDGAGLRIAQATSGASSRTGAIRLGRGSNSVFNTYLENVSGVFTIYNGVGNTGTNLFNIDTTDAQFNVPIAGATFSAAVVSDGGYRITSSAINTLTGTTYSLLTSDNGKVITCNNSSAVTLTIPSGLPVGYNTTIIQIGTGTIGITGSGTTLNSFENKFRTAGQHAAVSIISYSSNEFNIAGGLTG